MVDSARVRVYNGSVSDWYDKEPGRKPSFRDKKPRLAVAAPRSVRQNVAAEMPEDRECQGR